MFISVHFCFCTKNNSKNKDRYKSDYCMNISFLIFGFCNKIVFKKGYIIELSGYVYIWFSFSLLCFTA